MSREPTVQVRVVADDEIATWARVSAATVDEGEDEAKVAAELANASPYWRHRSWLAWLAGSGDGPDARKAIARLRMELNGRRAMAWSIGVLPEAFAQGLEPALLRGIEVSARAAGAQHLLLQVTSGRVATAGRAGYRLLKSRVEMVADLEPKPVASDARLRHPRPDDEAEVQSLGRLYYEAYRGTIDDEGDTPEEALEETRRCLRGGYGRFLADCSYVLDADAAGELAGAALITHETDGEALLAEAIVHPRYRGQGYARPLIQSAMNACVHRGYRRMWLMVTRHNVPAEGLYRRLGFREEPGSEVYQLEKEL
jgi:ribosomal protein S18 acetylase RimI-like enzyme